MVDVYEDVLPAVPLDGLQVHVQRPLVGLARVQDADAGPDGLRVAPDCVPVRLVYPRFEYHPSSSPFHALSRGGPFPGLPRDCGSPRGLGWVAPARRAAPIHRGIPWLDFIGPSGRLPGCQIGAGSGASIIVPSGPGAPMGRISGGELMSVVDRDRPFKLLVVDDEEEVVPIFRQRMRREVRSGTYELFFARSGVEALDLIGEEPDIDLVITDINMPEMDGLTLLERLRSSDVDLRSIVLSAYGDMTNIRAAMNLGAFDFVLKPVDFDDIRLTIGRTLSNLTEWRAAVASRDQLVSLNQEIDIAGRIQQSVLPLSFPGVEGYEIHALVNPARAVAGDFYDVMRLEGGLIGLLVADVCGKGIPAAMVMMSCRTLIRGAAIGLLDPGRVLSEVNRFMCENNPLQMFVTAFFGVFDPVDGSLTYANAGHPRPCLVRPDGDVTDLAASGGVALGLLPDREYLSRRLELGPGDTLFAFTDGVTEMMDSLDEEFGDRRLCEALSLGAGRGASDCIELVLESLRSFAGGRAQPDDVTCLALHRLALR